MLQLTHAVSSNMKHWKSFKLELKMPKMSLVSFLLKTIYIFQTAIFFLFRIYLVFWILHFESVFSLH